MAQERKNRRLFKDDGSWTQKAKLVEDGIRNLVKNYVTELVEDEGVDVRDLQYVMHSVTTGILLEAAMKIRLE